ncbi:MAG: hypothetical protein R3189_08240 [Thiomicrorhabdus chilensis]|uniref:hypothetical protein n=1 Tax=Thiomicrorhabdus chilensis TaxID=63656 RepID=UPI00299CDB52|nr:hypothetical protein [Thiomicrorhabdus chilensis]MDX1348219.1 hypothetical protein [Thiomicrorhabdus chilensis]
MTHAVTFWLPGLLDSKRRQEAGEQFNPKAFPILQNLLKKADLYPLTRNRDFYQTASQLFHQPICLPIAATMASILVPTFDADCFWVKLDPVQLIPDRDTLLLIPGKDLGIKEEEAKALIEVFNQHFEQDQVQIEYGTPTDWFLRIKQPIDLKTHTLDAVSYRSLSDHYPSGHAAQYWRQLLNEASMLFFNHPVNEERRQQSLPEINGLWLWGEGQLHENTKQNREKMMVWSENTYLMGMGHLCQAQIRSFPENQQAWSLEDADYHFLMPEILRQKLDSLSLEEWLQTLEWLEQEWLQPLYHDLRDKKIESLLLEFGDGFRYHLQPQHLKRFWRFKNRL